MVFHCVFHPDFCGGRSDPRKIEAAYTALYIVFGIVFLVYPPVSLYLRSKRTLAISRCCGNAACTVRWTRRGCTYHRRKRVRCFRGSRSIKWSRRAQRSGVQQPDQCLCHSESKAGGKLRGTADTGCGTSAGVPFEDEVENGDFKI